MTIRHRITLLVVLMFVALAAIGGYAVYQTRGSAAEVRQVTEGVVPSALASADLVSLVKDVQLATMVLVYAPDANIVAQAKDDLKAKEAALRAALEEELAEVGSERMHARLVERAPDAASKILPTNGRRIVRALEVVELTGSFTAELPDPTYHYPAVVQIGVAIDRPTLDRRIEERAGRMWAAGLVDEVRGLVDRGLRDGATASRALGYRQVLAYLDGETTEDEARERTVAGTRRFARKQDGWFRGDGRVAWVAYDDPDRIEVAIRDVLRPPASD